MNFADFENRVRQIYGKLWSFEYSNRLGDGTLLIMELLGKEMTKLQTAELEISSKGTGRNVK